MYHVPNHTKETQLKMDAVILRKNGIVHEVKKTIVCYALEKANHRYMTEAQENGGAGRIIDVVDLDAVIDGHPVEYEIKDTSLTEATVNAMTTKKYIVVVNCNG